MQAALLKFLPLSRMDKDRYAPLSPLLYRHL